MKRKGLDPRLIAASAVVTLLVFVVGYFALVAPRRHESARLASHIEQVREQIVTARLALRPTTRQAIEAAAFFPLARAMPTSSDMPDLVLQLSQIADETGITFKSITPGSPAAVGSYAKIPVDLEFDGRFYDLADFLFRLRNLVDVHGGQLHVGGRLFTVDGITFGQGDAKFPQVEATLTVDAYSYNGPDPVLTTPSPAPAGASALGAGVGG